MVRGENKLEGEGLVASLFHFLWTKNGDKCCPLVNIPDTVVYKYHQPAYWYFMSKDDGQIKMKLKMNVTRALIAQKFAMLDKQRVLDICSYHVWAPLLDYKSKSQPPVLIQHFDPPGLENFVHSGVDAEGIVQKFVQPKGEHAEIIRAVWTPNMEFLEKRINQLSVHDHSHSLHSRVATFEAPEQLTSTVVIPLRSALGNKLSTTIASIVRHIAHVSRVSVTRLVLHFKMGRRDKLWLLWCTCLRVQKSELPKTPNSFLVQCAAPSAIKDELTAIQVKKKRGARAPVQRFFVCHGCSTTCRIEQQCTTTYQLILNYLKRQGEHIPDANEGDEFDEKPKRELWYHPRPKWRNPGSDATTPASTARTQYDENWDDIVDAIEDAETNAEATAAAAAAAGAGGGGGGAAGGGGSADGEGGGGVCDEGTVAAAGAAPSEVTAAMADGTGGPVTTLELLREGVPAGIRPDLQLTPDMEWYAIRNVFASDFLFKDSGGGSNDANHSTGGSGRPREADSGRAHSRREDAVPTTPPHEVSVRDDAAFQDSPALPVDINTSIREDNTVESVLPVSETTVTAPKVPEVIRRMHPAITYKEFRFICQDSTLVMLPVVVCENCFTTYTKPDSPVRVMPDAAPPDVPSWADSDPFSSLLDLESEASESEYSDDSDLSGEDVAESAANPSARSSARDSSSAPASDHAATNLVASERTDSGRTDSDHAATNLVASERTASGRTASDHAATNLVASERTDSGRTASDLAAGDFAGNDETVESLPVAAATTTATSASSHLRNALNLLDSSSDSDSSAYGLVSRTVDHDISQQPQQQQHQHVHQRPTTADSLPSSVGRPHTADSFENAFAALKETGPTPGQFDFGDDGDSDSEDLLFCRPKKEDFANDSEDEPLPQWFVRRQQDASAAKEKKKGRKASRQSRVAQRLTEARAKSAELARSHGSRTPARPHSRASLETRPAWDTLFGGFSPSPATNQYVSCPYRVSPVPMEPNYFPETKSRPASRCNSSLAGSRPASAGAVTFSQWSIPNVRSKDVIGNEFPSSPYGDMVPRKMPSSSRRRSAYSSKHVEASLKRYLERVGPFQKHGGAVLDPDEYLPHFKEKRDRLRQKRLHSTASVSPKSPLSQKQQDEVDGVEGGDSERGHGMTGDDRHNVDGHGQRTTGLGGPKPRRMKGDRNEQRKPRQAEATSHNVQ